jgi:undecaprenyl-diphosphatase
MLSSLNLLDLFMPELIEAILLGVVQGLTEWLPVSSSGHLAMIQLLLGIRTGLLFDILLHLGTVCVIMVKFRKDISQIVGDFIQCNLDSDAARRGLFIVSGSIPTALIGAAFYQPLRSSFEDLFVIGAGFATSGLALHLSRNRVPDERRRLELLDSILIGVAQGVSIVPGISRSGLTISTGILIGLKREEAFKYSFLLSIPAILGAAFFEAANQPLTLIDWNVSLLGLAVAIVVGYASLSSLWTFVRRNQLHYFKYYCWFTSWIAISIAIRRIL